MSIESPGLRHTQPEWHSSSSTRKVELWNSAQKGGKFASQEILPIGKRKSLIKIIKQYGCGARVQPKKRGKKRYGRKVKDRTKGETTGIESGRRKNSRVGFSRWLLATAK